MAALSFLILRGKGKSGQRSAPHQLTAGFFRKGERDSAAENNRRCFGSPLGDLGAGKGENVG